MQHEAILLKRTVMLALLVVVIWEHYQRTIKWEWQAWRAKPKRHWMLRDREPGDCAGAPFITPDRRMARENA